MGRTTVGREMEEIRSGEAAEKSRAGKAAEENRDGKVVRMCVIRRSDGKYFEGCGYGGPGNPIPYWTDDVLMARQYVMPTSGTMRWVDAAEKRYGGHRGVVEMDGTGAVRWLGFLVRWRSGWRIIEDEPRDFDPHDYEGNNGPIG